MGRKPVKKPEKQVCQKCLAEKQITKFYMTTSKLYPNGRVGICNDCIKDMVDVDDVESLKDMLRLIDKPFVEVVWETVKDKSDPVGAYVRSINSLHQYKDLTWKDSNKTKALQTHNSENINYEDYMEVSSELYKKWGRGFEPDEILDFEELYGEWRNNYEIKTPMQETFLKHAVIASVKATRAIADGDDKKADTYMKMFKEATSGGKLQPQQLSRADLGDSIDTFSQLVKRVESSVEVIPVLPKFLEKPKDKVDVCLWAFVNYVRGLKNLGDVEYKDIYRWYEDRKADYERNMTDSVFGNNNEG